MERGDPGGAGYPFDVMGREHRSSGQPPRRLERHKHLSLHARTVMGQTGMRSS